ncbi:hypothetical protein, partial [Actinomadura soli]|uniref:hypothetical protein n=1 Tax=Actinomadura soli TaxID=2508997 RepID=UPI00197AF71D
TSATTTSTTARRHGDGPTGLHPGAGEDGGDHPAAGTPVDGPTDRATGGHRSGGPDAGWGFDPADADAVDQAAKGLVDRLDEFIAETVPPPEHATRLDDLNSARNSIDNTAVPEAVAAAVTALLAERGTKGARRDELVARLDAPRSTVARYLGSLCKEEIITRAGNGKAARYYLPDHAPDDHAE